MRRGEGRGGLTVAAPSSYRLGVRQALPTLRGEQPLHGPVPCRPLARSAGAKHRPQVVSPACAAAYPRALARDVQRRA